VQQVQFLELDLSKAVNDLSSEKYESGMHVLYAYRQNFPNTRAGSIQVVKTCTELAKLGVRVTLCVNRIDRKSKHLLYDVYGVDMPDGFILREMVPSCFNWSRVLSSVIYNQHFRHECRIALQDDRDVFIYTRNKGGLRLLESLFSCGSWPKSIYEAHNLMSNSHKTSDIVSGNSELGSLDRKYVKKWQREAKVFSSTSGLVCITSGLAEDLRQFFSPKCPVCVIPSGVTPNELPIRYRDIDIVYCGHLDESKGVDVLVRAMQWLPGRHATLIGGRREADLERVRKLAKQVGVLEQIHLVGFVAPRLVPDYLARAKIGVVPTPGDGDPLAEKYTSPMKLLELMMNGVAVIASDVPSSREIISDGKTGELVPPSDGRALATKIAALLENELARRKLAVRAHQHVQAFTWESRARNIRDFLLRCGGRD
jgi:glycosyltransferase involved in cell wall biosynthesis